MTKLVAVAICSSFLVAAAISIGATSKYWMRRKEKEVEGGKAKEDFVCENVDTSKQSFPNSDGRC